MLQQKIYYEAMLLEIPNSVMFLIVYTMYIFCTIKTI